MIKQARHRRILSILQKEGVVELHDLAHVMPDVSLVTLRRDLGELAEAGALKRTHGGAALADAEIVKGVATPRLVASDSIESELESLDAIILPPIPGRGSDALRRQIARRSIPYIAESAAQAGGTYLGPDNYRAAFELGRHAGAETKGGAVHLLLVCQTELQNTIERSEGFEAGFREAFSGDITVTRVNGQGSFRPALRVALDALKTNESITVAMGVNDHSALAAIEAGERVGRHLKVYATGGENPNFIGRLAEAGPLRAVAAFFPTVVGRRAIDLVADALTGRTLDDKAISPHAIITPACLADYYREDAAGWSLLPEREAELIGGGQSRPVRQTERKRIGFMPHYPAHDWYRNLMQAMQARANEYGFALVVSPPHQGIAAEISRLRREIGRAAAAKVRQGQTIIIGEGEATRFMAQALHRRSIEEPGSLDEVTVITNALDVMSQLVEAEALKVILTSGEYQKADRCLVGPSLGALFERMRADTAYISVSGVSPEFGLSTMDERRALAGSRFVDAARRVVALADHTAIGTDDNYRIARTDAVHVVITDDGALPADRQRLRDADVEVLIASEGEEPSSNLSATEDQRSG